MADTENSFASPSPSSWVEIVERRKSIPSRLAVDYIAFLMAPDILADQRDEIQWIHFEDERYSAIPDDLWNVAAEKWAALDKHFSGKTSGYSLRSRPQLGNGPDLRAFLNLLKESLEGLKSEHRLFFWKRLFPKHATLFEKFFSSKVFCPAAWIGVNIHPTGKVLPCCAFKQDRPLGDLRSQSLSEIRARGGFWGLRQNMFFERPSSGCESCYVSEKSGGDNLRLHLLKTFEHFVPLMPVHYDSLPPLFYLDVQFSNLCNFKCRICSPTFSSRWSADHAALYGKSFSTNPVISIQKNAPRGFEEILDNVDHLHEVYFWGGEPLIMPEHYEFLENLLRRGLSHVRLRYSTNFSQLELQNSRIIDLWKQFAWVSVGASLDGSGARGEYMRKGQDWNLVEKNRQMLLEKAPDVHFFIACAVSAYNALHVADFFQEWVEKGWVEENLFCLNLLQTPRRKSVQILPPKMKAMVVERVQRLISEFIRPRFGVNSVSESRFQALVHFMLAGDASDLWSDFICWNRRLDTIREEDLFTAIPELSETALVDSKL